MFNNRDEYRVATENASINQHGKANIKAYKFGIFNFFILTTICVMGYLSFDAINVLSREKMSSSNNIDGIENKNELELLKSAINSVVSDSTSNDNSIYTQAISRELDKKSIRTIIVKKGDTLETLAMKYYENPLAYDKIIAHNSSLNGKSHIIFTGQKLILPY